MKPEELRTFRCVVTRKQSWTLEVRAKDEEAAKEQADLEASGEPAHDDWAYETTAREI